MSRSSPEFEPAAVPANDNAYGEAVSDEEFAAWVRRSQADTDAVLEAWDDSVEFTQRYEPDGPEELEDDELEEDPRQPQRRLSMERAARIATESARRSFYLERAADTPPLFGPGPAPVQTEESIEDRHAAWLRVMEDRYGIAADGSIGPHPGDGVSWQRGDGDRDLYAGWHAELEYRRSRQRLEDAGVLVVERAQPGEVVGLASTMGLQIVSEADMERWARQTFGL
jgi:hypothetical protein